MRRVVLEPGEKEHGNSAVTTDMIPSKTHSFLNNRMPGSDERTI